MTFYLFLFFTTALLSAQGSRDSGDQLLCGGEGSEWVVRVGLDELAGTKM